MREKLCVAARTRSRRAQAETEFIRSRQDEIDQSPTVLPEIKRRRTRYRSEEEEFSPFTSSEISICEIDHGQSYECIDSSSRSPTPARPPVEEEDVAAAPVEIISDDESDSEKGGGVGLARSNGDSVAARTRSSGFLMARWKAVDYRGFFEESEDEEPEDSDEEVETNVSKCDRRPDLGRRGTSRSVKRNRCELRLEDDPVLQKLLNFKVDGSIPSQFSFGDDDDLEPPEKSEFEKELDGLWTEFDFFLYSDGFGTFKRSEAKESEEGGASTSSCKNGDGHKLFLDEKIGMRCSVCSFIQQEIKQVLPTVATECRGGEHSSRRGERRTRRRRNSPPLPSEEDKEEISLSGATSVWDAVPGARSTLYPHQQRAFEFLWTNLAGGLSLPKPAACAGSGGGCVIAHRPGSGKTRLAILFIQSFLRVFPRSRAVVVAPKPLLPTWHAEFLKWCRPRPPALHCADSSRAAAPALAAAAPPPVLLLSYGVFSRLPRAADRPDSLLVVDEGHTARNDKTRAWRALNRAGTPNRVLLSGTLFQNSLHELRNTLRLARAAFDARRWDAAAAAADLPELRRMLRELVHVYGGDAAGLPPLFDALLVLDPSPAQRRLLKAVEEDEAGTLRRQHRSSLAAVHPSLGGDGGADPAQGVKTRFVAELLRRCGGRGERVLIFGQFLEPLELVGRQLGELFGWEAGREVLKMDGDLAVPRREAVMAQFNDEAGPARVLLASTRACAEGISLTGASRVVLLDVVWNPAVEWQAISRAYRVGQKRAVRVYRLVVEGAGEWKKHRAQVSKDCMARLILSLDGDQDPGTGAGACRPPDNDVDDVLEEMMAHEELRGMFRQVIRNPMRTSVSDVPLHFSSRPRRDPS
ncbi:SNF2 domain-containing protein CLASSY 3-like isoform X2 [Wolffia australiana]